MVGGSQPLFGWFQVLVEMPELCVLGLLSLFFDSGAEDVSTDWSAAWIYVQPACFVAMVTLGGVGSVMGWWLTVAA